jgi:hypothetical protein
MRNKLAEVLTCRPPLLLVSWPEDPFTCAEFDYDRPAKELLLEIAFTRSGLRELEEVCQRVDHAMNLRVAEFQAARERAHRIDRLVRPILDEGAGTLGAAIRMLVERYEQKRAENATERMLELEELIAPVRRLQPRLTVLQALGAAMPPRIAAFGAQ